MKIDIQPSKECVVRFGTNARKDPDTEVRIAKEIDGVYQWVERQFVSGKKKIKFPDLTEGNYHVGVFGNKIAGVAVTGGHEVPFPFNVFLDPPEDHSKDYMRIDVPATQPIEGNLKRSIKEAIKATKH